MKIINIHTSIEVPDNWSAEEVYQEFQNEYLIPAADTGDLSLFIFTDKETGDEIE